MPGFPIDGEKVRERRRYLFLTQKELSERSQITDVRISTIEQGGAQARASTLRLLAAALEMEPQEPIEKR